MRKAEKREKGECGMREGEQRKNHIQKPESKSQRPKSLKDLTDQFPLRCQVGGKGMKLFAQGR